jgi:voltage-gated potassium channel
MLGDWAIFFLALLLVPVLLLEETSGDPTVVGIATIVNAVIWGLFAVDYALDRRRSRDRRVYVRSHWFDLAIIVVSPPLLVPTAAQALRVLRVMRLLGAFAVTGVVAEQLDRPLTRSAALAILGVLAATFIGGGILMTAVEPGTFPNVFVAYLWTIATLVTAGHAAPEPMTAVGRAISTTVIVVGLGSFAALAASVVGPREG